MVERLRLTYWLAMAAVGLFLAMSLTGPVQADPDQGIGVVVLHGKTGNPNGACAPLIAKLKAEGFDVLAPELPWSKARYLDRDYPQALDEIAEAVAKLHQRGHGKVVLCGHSLGANAALAYAVSRGGVDGLILLAPGHTPDRPGFQARLKNSVEQARDMVGSGQGQARKKFRDVNMGQVFKVKTQARIYFSYFDPQGLGNMPANAARLSPGLPMLYVVGTGDRLYDQGQDYIYAKAPANPLSHFAVVGADHLGTPAAAKQEVTDWLGQLARASGHPRGK